jgi:hypothetical protein
MSALALDSRNDVASNIVALVCGLLGMIEFHIIHTRDRQTKIDYIFSNAHKIANNQKSCSYFKYMNFLASNALKGKIKQEAIVIDPIGAILISVYIIISWILQANSKYCLGFYAYSYSTEVFSN